MRIEAENFRVLASHSDDTLMLTEAVRRLRDGDTLVLSPRTYHFYPEYAFEYRKISAPFAEEQRCVFYLFRKKKITIEGGGAELIFHGNVVPFCFIECEDIAVSNLSVDFSSPFFAQAAIEEADERHVVLRFEESETRCAVRNKGLVFYNRKDDWSRALGRVLALEYSAETGAPQAGQPTYFACFNDQHDDTFQSLNRRLKAEALRDGRVRLSGDFGFSHTVGNNWVCVFDTGLYHDFLCCESKNLSFSDICVYCAPSKAFSALNCENLSFERCRVTTREGSKRILATDAEGFFFRDCRGKIELCDCTAEKNMCNGVDIRTCLCDVQKAADEKSLYLRFGEGKGIFRGGDRVRLFSEDGSFDRMFTAESFETVSSSIVRLTLRESLPKNLPDGLLAENFSESPDVSLVRCAIGNNRPYAVSILTRGKVRIRDCTLYSVYSALVIGGATIPERIGGGVEDAHIEKNRFFNCSYNGGFPVRVRGKKFFSENKAVSVEKNIFVSPQRCFLSADTVGEICFCDNVYCEDKTLARSVGAETVPFAVNDCERLRAEEPTEENEKRHLRTEQEDAQ